MIRRTIRFPTLLLLAACTADDDPVGDTDPTATEGIAWCEGSVTQRWDPLHDLELATFPDLVWTRADAASPTGLRVDVEGAPWLAEMPVGVVDLVGPFSELSGFGRLGAIVLRFDGDLGEVPADAAASLVDDGLILAELTPEGPVRVPYRATTGEHGDQLVVQPLAVLSPGAPHALVLTTAHAAADGGCVRPSPTFRALFEGDVDPRIAATKPAHEAALDALGLTPADVSAMTVFTTHDEVATGLLAAADDIAASTFAWDGERACEDREGARLCRGSFTATDYRTAGGGVLDGLPHGTWTLDVDVWLPKTPGPHPVLMFGHGMNGDRGQAAEVVPELTDEGFAIVAADALFHGDHPTTEGLAVTGGLPFLGLDLDAGSVSLRQVRGSFVQTPLDRAQVLGLLRDAPDVDGDGEADVDTSRLGYLGISLGGLLGPGLLAAHPDTGAAVLSVAGGHLSVFVTSTGITEQIHPLLVGLVGSEDGLDRFLALAQAAIDGADPAVIADHVTGAHALGAPADVLLQCAHHDDVVPPPTGEMLARGLRAPRLLPGAWAVDAVQDGPARTSPVVAYQQFEQVTDGDQLVDAGHGNTPKSPEAFGQAVHFLTSWRDTGTAEVVAPTP
jgi:dienelactone hydrolase